MGMLEQHIRTESIEDDHIFVLVLQREETQKRGEVLNLTRFLFLALLRIPTTELDMFS